MADNVAIKVEHVSKTFRLPHDKQSSIKGGLISLIKGGKRTYENQEVLKDVSFEIEKGEFFGIVGRNGSGKSTLLKMLAGIYAPTKGHIQVNGKLTPFIELGVGFNPELTGRENVFLNGALLGFNRAEMQAMYEDIVAFAELERFMDQKLKNYSSGMQVRLAFSIAIRADTAILLLDEVLAVGDAIFQQKCFDYFKELKKAKKTVVLVSHDTSTLQQYCSKGILVEKGHIVTNGTIEKVVSAYQDILANQEAVQGGTPTEKKKSWGSGDITVADIAILAASGAQQSIFTDKDETIQLEVVYIAQKDAENPIYGLVIDDTAGQQLFASNTLWSHIESPDMVAGTARRITWRLPNVFNTGTYKVSPAVSNSSGTKMYNWVDAMAEFKVRKKLESTAFINAPHHIENKLVKPGTKE